MLYDTRAALLDPMATLFAKIYATGLIPEQRKVSKKIKISKYILLPIKTIRSSIQRRVSSVVERRV